MGTQETWQAGKPQDFMKTVYVTISKNIIVIIITIYLAQI